jgi:hypothetical protein
MIEYCIDELKYYYNKYDEGNSCDSCNSRDIHDSDDAANINYIEETVSNIIDDDYTHNNIYHIFPAVVCAFFSILLISGVIMVS